MSKPSQRKDTAGHGVIVFQPQGVGPNPYVRLLSTHLSEIAGISVLPYASRKYVRSNQAIWHLHFPERVVQQQGFISSLLRGLLYLVRLKAAHLRGIRIVWTAHNLVSHDRRHPNLENWFRRGLCRIIDGWISMSHEVQNKAETQYPILASKATTVIPHGHYRDVYPRSTSRQEARQALNLGQSETVILFFGSISHYKNVKHLIRCFKALSDAQLHLVIAGHCENAVLQEEIVREVDDHPRVKLRLEFIPEIETQLFFNSANLVALPFRNITNSGSAILAMSFGVPTLVPAMGSMRELALSVGEEWIYVYDGDMSEEVLKSAASWARSTKRDQAPRLADLEWDRIALMTAGFYQSILHGDRAPRS